MQLNMKKPASLFFLAATLLFSNAIFAAVNAPKDSALSYTYTVPYGGAGQLAINNNTSENISILSIEFDTNAQFSGAPYGALFAYGATYTVRSNPDGLTYHYVITEPKPVVIAAGASENVTYPIGTINGPLSLAMNAMNVVLNGNKENLPVAGACQGASCNDPTPGKRVEGYYTDWDMYARNFPNAGR